MQKWISLKPFQIGKQIVPSLVFTLQNLFRFLALVHLHLYSKGEQFSTKKTIFIINSSCIYNFRSSDSNWIFVSGCVTGILLIFSFFELWAVVKIFLAKPIRLNPSQSKLLGAKGIDFEVKQSKPKPNVLNTRDMETSLSSCLLNRSLDSPKNGQPLKKSNVQSPTILRNRR